jgi:hypothetical protein
MLFYITFLLQANIIFLFLLSEKNNILYYNHDNRI